MTRVTEKPEQEEPADNGWQVPDDLKVKWASRAEAAEILKLSVDTIDRWVKDGRLTKRDYHGKHTLISRSSIKAIFAPFLRD